MQLYQYVSNRNSCIIGGYLKARSAEEALHNAQVEIRARGGIGFMVSIVKVY